MRVMISARHNTSGHGCQFLGAFRSASAARSLLLAPTERPGNRHAELLILCARIGFNP